MASGQFTTDYEPHVHGRKPDPDEPWRYVCPRCELQVQGKPTSSKYRCDNCDEYWDGGQLRDLRAN